MDNRQKADDCPICQGPAKVRPDNEGGGTRFYVECAKEKPCVFTLLYPTMERALEVWNTRTEKKVDTGLPSGLL